MDELLNRCHAAHLRVLEDFKKVCSKHNLKWYAFCGTLLGAVRHKGFVPWDDDLDICMMRNDYNLFLYYAKTEMPEYFIDTYDSYHPEERRHYDFVGITRINNTYSPRLDSEFLETYGGFPYSAGIDLYPLDYVPNDEIYDVAISVYKFVIMTGYKYKSINWELYIPPAVPNKTLDSMFKEIKRATGEQINPKKDVLKQLNDLAVKISTYTKSSDRVACMMHTAFEKKMIFKVSWFKERIEVPFEDTTIFVPAGYDEILKVNYGRNYMIPNMRVPHEYPYYKFQERIIKEIIQHHPALAEQIPEYFMEDLKEKTEKGGE